MYEKPTMNLIGIAEGLKAFLLARTPAFTTSVPWILGSPVNLTLFTEDVILYVGHLKISQTSLEPENSFSKVAGCKVSTKNQMHLFTLAKRKSVKQSHLQYYQK